METVAVNFHTAHVPPKTKSGWEYIRFQEQLEKKPQRRPEGEQVGSFHVVEKEHERLWGAEARDGDETMWFVWEPGNVADMWTALNMGCLLCQMLLTFHKREFHLGNSWYISFCIHSLFFTSFWQNVVFTGHTQPIPYLFWVRRSSEIVIPWGLTGWNP